MGGASNGPGAEGGARRERTNGPLPGRRGPCPAEDGGERDGAGLGNQARGRGHLGGGG